jgi:hypothetical protein
MGFLLQFTTTAINIETLIITKALQCFAGVPETIHILEYQKAAARSWEIPKL